MARPTISDYPISIYNLLTYMGVSRTKLTRLEGSGRILYSASDSFAFCIYAIFHINSWCKGIYLILLFAGVWNFHLEFFDYIAALLWFLIFIEICIGDHLLMRRLPYFEVLSAGLKLQDEIFDKLSEASINNGILLDEGAQFQKKQDVTAVKKVWFQWIIILMGIAACILQYSSAPKYCIFTNALIETDTPLVNWAMGLHDVGFIVHAWMLYGTDIAVQSVIGGQLQHCLHLLTSQLRNLRKEKFEFSLELPLDEEKEVQNIDEKNEPENDHKMKVENETLILRFEEKLDEEDILTPKKLSQADLFEEKMHHLILSYRSLGIYAHQMNECCSYNFLSIHVIAYVQMTCDVFVIFQLLRTEGSQPSDVAYFIEDCVVCMYLLFKCFKAISFVGEESQKFLNEILQPVSLKGRRLKLYRKTRLSLPHIVMKLGPGICDPSTVGNACMLLMNYYIMVALWK